MFLQARILFFAFLFLMTFMFSSIAAPEKNLGTVWQTNNPSSQEIINHDDWQNFLTHYVTTDPQGINLVHYKQVSAEDKKQLKDYLKKLSHTSISHYNRNEQLAYWINLYNALTVDLVLNHYPVKSIQDIKLNSSGPWDAKLMTVEGTPLSLNDIEHRILLPIWHDSRIYYALSSAAYGSPNLQKNIFTGKKIHHLLNAAGVGYVNNPRGVDIKNKKLIISKIFIWNKSDFGGTDLGIIDHLLHYAKPTLEKPLSEMQKINGSVFDWKLNDGSGMEVKNN